MFNLTRGVRKGGERPGRKGLVTSCDPIAKVKILYEKPTRYKISQDLYIATWNM